MNRLIPTQIVDRNGRRTTVHKKDQSTLSASSVGMVKPTLSVAANSQQETVIIKGRPLHKDSLALKLFSHDWDQQYELTSGKNDFAWRDEVEIPKSAVFQYLRLGIDVADGATLYGLGYLPEDLADNSATAPYLPGRLKQITKSKIAWQTKTTEVISRFEAAGISIEATEKALSNHIQDDFLNGVLNEHQLAELFNKWNYNSVAHDSLIKKSKRDSTINGFVTGTIPFECRDIPLQNLYEIHFEMSIMMRSEADELRKDHDLYVRIVRKAASSMTGINRVFDLNRMISKHGEGVLELDDPFLCSARLADGSDAGLEDALYFEAVHRYAKEHGQNFFSEETLKYGYKGCVRVDGIELYNNDLHELRKGGASPVEAYEGLALRGLSPAQIIVSKEDGIAGSLADGAL